MLTEIFSQRITAFLDVIFSKTISFGLGSLPRLRYFAWTQKNYYMKITLNDGEGRAERKGYKSGGARMRASGDRTEQVFFWKILKFFAAWKEKSQPAGEEIAIKLILFERIRKVFICSCSRSMSSSDFVGTHRATKSNEVFTRENGRFICEKLSACFGESALKND